MNYETLILSENEKIWTLTINRPSSLNALNSLVLKELDQALTDIQSQSFEGCRGLIITGSGEKAFVAGADIKELNSLNQNQAMEFALRGQSLFRKIENLKIPVLAAVNGFALGGGLELALSCDFIYASENAKVGLPEVSLGLIPGFGGTVRLSRVVGQNRAKELTYSAEMLPATEAFRIGLVNKVMPLTELLLAAQTKLQTIAKQGPVAIAAAKKSILQSYDQEIDQAMKTEATHFSNLFTTQDFKEGTSAFVEKRKAQFKGN